MDIGLASEFVLEHGDRLQRARLAYILNSRSPGAEILYLTSNCRSQVARFHPEHAAAHKSAHYLRAYLNDAAVVR